MYKKYESNKKKLVVTDEMSQNTMSATVVSYLSVSLSCLSLQSAAEGCQWRTAIDRVVKVEIWRGN